MKTIGIVVPIYNTDKYLEQCIESIINQSYQNIKIVLVDDGSTDNSRIICDKYSKLDGRVCVIHQENKGVLSAIYNGVLNLNCDYVTCVDSDDWIDKSTYESLLEYINNDIDIISYNIIRYFDEKNQIVTSEKYEKCFYDKKKIEKDIYPTMIWNIEEKNYGLDPSLCNKVIKRNLFLKYVEKCKFLNTNFGQDIAIIYPLMTEATSLLFLDRALYYHRQRQIGIIPGYYLDDNFYNKTFDLFCYLRKFFCDSRVFNKQIEYLYTVSLKQRIDAVYGDDKVKQTYVFPYHKVEEGKRIIIYGAGTVGQSYIDQIIDSKKFASISLFDKNKKGNYRGVKIYNSDDLKCIDYDYIVVATANNLFMKEIVSFLKEKGVPEEKIVV